MTSKIALVTGGSRGLGKDSAIQLAKKDSTLFSPIKQKRICRRSGKRN